MDFREICQEAFRDLILLLEENERSESLTPTTDITYTSTSSLPKPSKKFKPKSKKFPDLTSNPHIWAFLTATIGDLRRLTLDPMPKNLRPDQLQSLAKLRNCPDLVIKQSKGAILY